MHEPDGWDLDRPFLLLLWLVVVPILTVPLTQWGLFQLVHSGACVTLQRPEPSLFSSNYSSGNTYFGCPSPAGLAPLLPGLFNLLPALWLRSSRGVVRAAAALATGLGLVRLAVPAVIAAWGSQHVQVYHLPQLGDVGYAFVNDTSWTVSLALWGVTVLALVGWCIVPPYQRPDTPRGIQ
jgi:hypothetical protein